MWKTIPDFPNYEASSEGGIRCKVGNVEKKSKETKHGYLETSLHIGKKQKKTRSIHRLVASAWIPNPDNKPEVNHIDGNKKNNHINNLEWVTRKENFEHARKNGLMDGFLGSSPRRGESHRMAKLTEHEVKAIFQLKGTKTAREIADYFNVSLKTVQSIHYRWRWKHVTDSLVDAFNKSADPEQ